jgi:hypothetical protein
MLDVKVNLSYRSSRSAPLPLVAGSRLAGRVINRSIHNPIRFFFSDAVATPSTATVNCATASVGFLVA